MRGKSSLAFFVLLWSFILFPSLASAQWFYFGRNKVQYTNFDWHILKTEHFDIYYYPEMEELAEKGAYYAEESFRYLQNKFNFYLNRRIPLIFYSSHLHFQQTNITPSFIPEGVGGFFEFIKGRVVIPSDGSLNQFKKVIRHELVHVFMHSKVYYVNKEHARFEGTYPPLWFVEGLAEFWSGDWDAQAEMVLRDAVLNNYLVPLSKMYQINGTYMMYKEGQAILEYIAEKYGEEKILLLMENIWKHSRFEEVFWDVLGKNYQEFDQEWIYYLKKRYYPLLKKYDMSQMVTQTIVREGYNFKPAFYRAPDKEKVVFIGNRSGYTNIYMTDLIPRTEKTPEKSEILIKGERSSEFETFHLFSSKIDVDRDGNLAFSSKSGERDALYIYNIPERRIVHKYQWPDIVGISSPAFSPDGQKVAFSGLDFSGKKDLFYLDLRSQELIRLTNDYYDDKDPCFSPDGRYLVFSSDRTEFGDKWSYNLFVFNLQNGLIYYVTTGKCQDNSPVWSPSGKYIAFTSDRDSSLNIWVVDVSDIREWKAGSYLHTRIKQLSFFTNASFDPEWVDNDRLLFAVYENNRFQIREMDSLETKLEVDHYLANLKLLGNRKWFPKSLPGGKVLGKLRYQKKYSLDIAQTQVSQDPFWGTTGGAILSFTDMLGNDQYYFLIYNNAQSRGDFLRSFNLAITKVSLGKRTNYGYGLFRFAGRYFNYKDGFYYEDRAGGFFAITYPFSQFERIEFNTNFSYSDKEIFGEPRRLAVLTSHWFSFVSDNSLWYYTGPIEGHRYLFSIGNTYYIRWSNVNYYTVFLDLRQYLRLSRGLTYAIRFLTMYNEGKDARWFYLGGSWDMRGYHRWSIRGEKILFISNELRFPFIDYMNIKFPFLSMGFRAIRGALFFDAGNAWNERWPGFLGSMGFGFRMNLFGYFVLRLDIGKTTNFKRFTSRWFTQFFFGWDF